MRVDRKYMKKLFLDMEGQTSLWYGNTMSGRHGRHMIGEKGVTGVRKALSWLLI